MPVSKLTTDLVYLGGNAIACVAYLYVGVRLYRLSRRTGQLPEFLVAATFLLWALAYLIYDIPYAFVLSDDLVPAFFAYSSLLVLGVGNAAFAFFIRSVFRPDERWATGLVAAIVVSIVVGVAGSAWIGDWEGVDPFTNPWYWLEYFGTFAPITWMGAEGFAQYFKMRRRLKLGLCAPMACNRFLLWGVAGVLWMLLEVTLTATDFARAISGQYSYLADFGIALLEVVPVIAIWFVFFPPAFYCRWVEGGGSTETEEYPPAS